MDIAPTHLVYMQQGQQLTETAVIVDIIDLEAGTRALVLDQTVFYPQGGGQPYDQGVIESADGSAGFIVNEVRCKEGIVYHKGTITTGAFNVDDNVFLTVNKERRLLNSKNHTAGHIVDCALHMLGIELKPTSGYHFPEGAYVEYSGTMEENERAQLLPKIQEAVNSIIAQALPIALQFISLDEFKRLADFVPEYISADKPIRVMIIEGYLAIPCGGTHVQNTKDVEQMNIDKISNKKGNMRISYSLILDLI